MLSLVSYRVHDKKELYVFIGTPNSISVNMTLFPGARSKATLESTATVHAGLCGVASAVHTRILHAVSVSVLSETRVVPLGWRVHLVSNLVP